MRLLVNLYDLMGPCRLQELLRRRKITCVPDWILIPDKTGVPPTFTQPLLRPLVRYNQNSWDV